MLNNSLVELNRPTHSPYERLWAIVYANFADTIFTKQVCQAWVYLSAEVPHHQMCQRVQAACNSRVSSNLRHELKHFINAENAGKLAHTLGVIIEGIWVRAGLFGSASDSDSAIDEFEFEMIRLLCCSKQEQVLQQDARIKVKMIAGMVLNSRAFRQNVLYPKRSSWHFQPHVVPSKNLRWVPTSWPKRSAECLKFRGCQRAHQKIVQQK